MKHSIMDRYGILVAIGLFAFVSCLDKIPITYTLPQDHDDHVKIDLNFYDFQREVEKSLNRRLVFDEGTITVHELDRYKIRFDFEGHIHELMNDKNRSPVSGSVDVAY